MNKITKIIFKRLHWPSSVKCFTLHVLSSFMRSVGDYCASAVILIGAGLQFCLWWCTCICCARRQIRDLWACMWISAAWCTVCSCISTGAWCVSMHAYQWVVCPCACISAVYYAPVWVVCQYTCTSAEPDVIRCDAEWFEIIFIHRFKDCFQICTFDVIRCAKNKDMWRISCVVFTDIERVWSYRSTYWPVVYNLVLVFL